VGVVDAGVIAAIIGAISAVAAAVLGGIFGLRTYPRQKDIDRKEKLREERAKTYAAWLSAYAEKTMVQH
jgi:hypothetical protein